MPLNRRNTHEILVHMIYSSNMILIYIAALCLSVVTASPSFATKCETHGTKYYCPLKSDPSHFNSCCGDESTPIKCCETEVPQDDDQLLMVVSITVILSCFILSALMIVCCFWSRCPLFDLCWVNYSRKGVIAYTKEGEALNEPPDENEYAHQYSPVNVKINRVDDV